MQVVAEIEYDRRRPIGVGQGMNSTVYFAIDPQVAGNMAVKEIKKADFGNDIAAYFAEAKATFKSSHPNVVDIRYACQTSDAICLAMPYYASGSLQDRIKDRPLSLSEVIRVAQGLLTGLHHIHRVGYVHLDIKSANVLFTDTDEPVIADFGQARAITGSGVATVTRVDSWLVPPETIGSSTATALSDVYQAGLLLYTALNGDDFCKARRGSPTDARDRIVRGKYPNRQQFLPHVPKRLRTHVRKALQVLPTRRFRSAIDMADALGRVQLALDWQMEPLPNGGRRWTASRLDCATLVVEQVPDGSTFHVRTFTEQPGQKPRAKNKKENWRSGLSDAAALDHLKRVFQRLP